MLKSISLLIALSLNASHVLAEERSLSHNNTLTSENSITYPSENYILGPGDSIYVELLDIPEYSGIATIVRDGTLYLPRLRSLYVNGLTIDELKFFLEKEYSKYVKDPNVFVQIVSYRPIQVYIAGEVSRPGFYNMIGRTELPFLQEESVRKKNVRTESLEIGGIQETSSPYLSPTVFDAIRIAGGVTPFSDLSKINVTRSRPISLGGGKIRTTLNFIGLITNGDLGQNIKLHDGDTIYVHKSKRELREQIILATNSNLSPRFVDVFVSGRVRTPGNYKLPQGSTLAQALAAAGGQKILRGQVEFLRFNKNGKADKRKFFLVDESDKTSFKNPILMTGDIIRVGDSPLSATVNVLNEITGPALGIYSIYSIFK